MQRSIVAVWCGLVAASLVGLVQERGGGRPPTAFDEATVELREAAAGRRARPPWLGRSDELARLAPASERPPSAPGGPRAWLLGRRAAIDSLDAQDWDELPGIGPSLAARIRAAGPPRSLAALDEVRGVGPARMAALRTRLVSSPGHAVAPVVPAR